MILLRLEILWDNISGQTQFLYTLTKVFSPKIGGQKCTFCTLLTTTVLTFCQNDSFPLYSKSKCHYNLTQHFETIVEVKNFGHFWPLNLVRNAVFVHFWPRNFRPKLVVRNALFVHFWPQLFWSFAKMTAFHSTLSLNVIIIWHNILRL